MLKIVDLQYIIRESYKTAKSKGWHDEPVSLATTIANIHGELSEAWEEYRKNSPEVYYQKDGKPEGILAELADVIIRIGDHIGSTGQGEKFQDILLEKMEYNKGRSYRHGGKQA